MFRPSKRWFSTGNILPKVYAFSIHVDASSEGDGWNLWAAAAAAHDDDDDDDDDDDVDVDVDDTW